jgi:hypothetical protein
MRIAWRKPGATIYQGKIGQGLHPTPKNVAAGWGNIWIHTHRNRYFATPDQVFYIRLVLASRLGGIGSDKDAGLDLTISIPYFLIPLYSDALKIRINSGRTGEQYVRSRNRCPSDPQQLRH